MNEAKRRILPCVRTRRPRLPEIVGWAGLDAGTVEGDGNATIYLRHGITMRAKDFDARTMRGLLFDSAEEAITEVKN